MLRDSFLKGKQIVYVVKVFGRAGGEGSGNFVLSEIQGNEGATNNLLLFSGGDGGGGGVTKIIFFQNSKPP